MQKNKLTFDYFLSEFHKFREIMTSTEYSMEQKQDAFEGLLFVYVNVRCGEKDNETMKRAMSMLVVELPLRLGLEAVLELEKILGE